MTQRFRNFVFTINNWSEEDKERCQTMYDKYGTYLVYGEEVGENGTPHLQGYMEVKNALSLKSISKQLNRAHIEKRRGTALEAANYCKKDGKIEEFGSISKQGERCDIELTYEMAKKSVKMQDFLETKPNLQLIKIFEIAQQAYQKDRDFVPEVTWIWGPTGVGKTQWVVQREKDLWISGKSLRWWSGYENQEAVLFDDFRGDFCTFHELLRILDSTPYTVEVKGGSRKLNSKRMYITSCYPPEKVYYTREDVKQLLRRITEVKNMTQ